MDFEGTTRLVRDRCTLWEKKRKKKKEKKWSEEEKVGDINPRHTEIDDALLDLIQRFNETNSERKKESEEKNVKKEDLVKAQGK